ncbi:MAG: squalene/phytoene synthase family protein [Solirubrobacterales bacterium]|nr:squalene/phytoene synthase family protein [Solirubrobacterales bacterium]
MRDSRRRPPGPASDLARDYAQCEAITRRQAANFYYGIRLLPRERRQAMSAVYAFARRIDDIGDGGLAAAEKLRLLDTEAIALRKLEAGGDPLPCGHGHGHDPVIAALGDARSRFALPDGALGALIDGVRMDVEGRSYESFEELVLYCRRVAGAIGRLCLAIFALRRDRIGLAEAEALADDLGVALQITNILRDVREDAENGRVYLPAEDLRRFDLLGGEEMGATAAHIAELARAASSPQLAAQHAEELARMAALIRFQAARGREWFARGMTLGALLDRRSAACLLAMAGIYRRLLDRIERDPLAAFATRMSLPAHEKALVAARGMFGRGG